MSCPDARTGTSEETTAPQDTWRLANRSIECSVCVCRFRWSSRLAVLWAVVFWRCACGEAASSVPRGPPCHAVLSSNGLWHCIPEYPQRLLIQVCRFNSRLQSTSYRSILCSRATPNTDTHPLVARPSCPPLLPFFARLRQTCEARSSSSAGRGDLLPSCLLLPFLRGPFPRGPFPRRCSALRI